MFPAEQTMPAPSPATWYRPTGYRFAVRQLQDSPGQDATWFQTNWLWITIGLAGLAAVIWLGARGNDKTQQG